MHMTDGHCPEKALAVHFPFGKFVNLWEFIIRNVDFHMLFKGECKRTWSSQQWYQLRMITSYAAFLYAEEAYSCNSEDIDSAMKSRDNSTQ